VKWGDLELKEKSVKQQSLTHAKITESMHIFSQ